MLTPFVIGRGPSAALFRFRISPLSLRGLANIETKNIGGYESGRPTACRKSLEKFAQALEVFQAKAPGKKPNAPGGHLGRSCLTLLKKGGGTYGAFAGFFSNCVGFGHLRQRNAEEVT